MKLIHKIKSKTNVAKLNLGLIVLLFAFFFYTLFAPITPAIYDKPIVQNANSLVSGHTITYSIHTCRKVGDGVVTTVTRSLVPVDNKDNLQPIALSTDILTNPARCLTAKKTLIIPFSVPEGKYRLVIRGVYAIIPLRKPITVTAESDVLTIRSATMSQTLQDLIDANTLLQEQIKLQAPTNGSRSTTTPNGNGSSTTSTNTNRTTTNNSTTNNTTPAPQQQAAPSQPTTPAPVQQDPSLIQGIIDAIGGGIKLGL